MLLLTFASALLLGLLGLLFLAILFIPLQSKTLFISASPIELLHFLREYFFQGAGFQDIGLNVLCKRLQLKAEVQRSLVLFGVAKNRIALLRLASFLIVLCGLGLYEPAVTPAIVRDD